MSHGLEGLQDFTDGYKKTEVGVIPVEWDIKKISKIGKVVRGGSPRPAGSPKFFGGNYIPWLTVAALTNIPEFSVYVNQTFGFLTEEGAKQSRKLENGTLIIANSGATLGVAKILLVKCCANDGIAALIDLSKDVEKLFLYYFLNTKTKEFREVIATGNGQPNLNTTLIGLTKIPLPPFPEQKAIALSLSDTDALIAACESAITKKRNIKQGAMQQLLTGKMRLPGFSGEWEVKKLGELGATNKPPIKAGPFGSSLKKSYYVKEGYKIYGQEQVIAKDFSIGNYYIDKQRFESLKSCAIQPKDILISLVGTFGKVVVVPEAIEPGIINPRLIRLSLNWDKVCPYFVKDLLISSTTQKLLEQTSHGGTMGIINAKTLNLLPISSPPLPEQKAIAQILSDTDAEIAALEKKRDKYKAIKQGMMQELLTGKTRLNAD
ncbi:MAG: restriction endonuclease subunit S [Cyanobacteria bacterium P01_A01_bin.68]